MNASIAVVATSTRWPPTAMVDFEFTALSDIPENELGEGKM
jgi:hypothetical protein